MDLLRSPRKKYISITRHMPNEMERGKCYQVTIHFENNALYSCKYRLVDGIPQSFQSQFPIEGEINSKTRSSISYKTRASVRGDYPVNKIYVRFSSLMGLWEKQIVVEQKNAVKVIPDLSETKRYLEDAQRYLMYDGDKIRKQKKGTGEFTRIRNYVIGDDPRKINWRQTAKLQEVMTNEYEPEHGKYITILIDCGRMMGVELKIGNRLEKAMEASLTVVAAALKNGDYVGVIVFSKGIDVYVPPAKGMDQLQKILQAIYNVKVDASESNYAAVMNYLQMVQKKRSLILLFSDIHTFLHDETTLLYLKRIRRRHLFFMIGVEDEALLSEAQQLPADVHRAMTKSMAQQQVLFKKREKAKWESQGLVMIEAKEEKLAVEAVSYYIRVMNQGLI